MSGDITIGTVRGWKPSTLEQAAAQMRTHRDALVSLDDELGGGAPPDDWTGAAAESAGEVHAKIRQATRNLTAEVAAARTATIEAVDAIEAVQKSLAETEDLAKANGFSIKDDGSVTDSDPPQDVPADQIEAVRQERTAIRDEVTSRLGEILRRAADIDEDLAGVLGKARKDELEGSGSLENSADIGAAEGGLSTLKPPASDDPAANAAWWDSLSEQERQEILEHHPDWVGNLDGVPAEIRDQANRERLETERERLEEEIAELEAALDDNFFGGTFSEADERLEDAKAELEALETTEQTLEQGDRQLLLFDLSGEVPRAAVANGDVDNADHVAVLTPGMNSGVVESLENKDAEMHALRQEAQDQAAQYGDGGSVATVTWVGYDSPNAASVLGDGSAEEGGQALADFYTGINASRTEDPNLTALGHSYGGVTTEYALMQENTGVDNTVLFGTPGHAVEDADQLQVPDGSVYTLSAEGWDGDWIEGYGQGPSPRGDIEGTTELSAEADGARDLQETDGHSDYMTEDTTSQYNMGAIVSGNSDRIVEK
ncbi:alpha/beta hydrolase [Saccharopolyspora cebuensis]|uniref:Alpha/beta hydrolase n=1 Tax=Saccharopolyspora cebuensis TaxID=418759 RepID=A0ABV4CT82_9PSEU